MTLWKFAGREVKSRPGRAILTLLSIVIGVAAVVSVTLATSSTRRAYREMYERITGKAALEIEGVGGGGFPESVVSKIESSPGIRAAVPSLQRPVIMYAKDDRKLRLLAMGIDPKKDQQARDYQLEHGRYFGARREAILETNFARSLGIKVGDKVRLLTPSSIRPRVVTVVGLLSPRGAAGFNKGGIIFLPLSVAQDFFRERDNINTVDLVLDDSADEDQVAAAVSKILPAGLHVRFPASRTQMARQTLVSTEQGLQFGCVLAIVLAIFIILNTFLMNVSERRRQMAVLRTIGATSPQIMWMLLSEGLLMGVLGTVIGCGVGYAGADLLVVAMARVLGATLPSVQAAPGPFILAAVLGPGVALAATYFPARIAARVSPLEGMRPAVVDEHSRVPAWATLSGGVCFLLSGAVLAACFEGWLPMVASITAGAVFLVSFVFLIPLLLNPLSRAIAAMLSPWSRVESQLAHRQVVRRRTRTTLTIAVLYIAISTGIGLGTTIINNVQDVRSWYRKTLVGDFFVRALFPDPATGEAAEMPESFAEEIRKIPGVKQVGTVRLVSSRIGDQPVVVVVRDFRQDQTLPMDLKAGSPEEVRRGLDEGQVVVGTVLAQLRGLKVGDVLTIDTRKGAKDVRVCGLANDYSIGGNVLYMEREFGETLLGATGADVFQIKAAPDSLNRVETQLRAFTDQHGLMLHSFAELSKMVDSIMSGVVGSLWAILALGFVVAAFGISNTLTMNVLEQTRELALLRTVAMTRRQIRRLIVAQAAIIGIIGLASGILAGVLTAFVINQAAMPQFGHPIQFVFQPVLMIGSFGIALIIVFATSWLPAERAARLDLISALQTT